MKKHVVLYLLVGFLLLSFMQTAVADSYIAEVYFTVPNTVYTTGENISFRGFVYMANYSTAGNRTAASSAFQGAAINLTIYTAAGVYVSNYSFTTDENGSFYSFSDYYTGATPVTAPATTGYYNLRVEYIDPAGTTWYAISGIAVINQTTDILRVSADKSRYNAGETMSVEVEAIKLVGGRVLRVSGVSVNGSSRNSSKGIIESFSCTTEDNGKCEVEVDAPSTYGTYYLELNDFKVFNSFSVVPFAYSIYMKDELGKSLKNVYAIAEQGTVEVQVSNASASDTYTFSGNITDALGNVTKTISSTVLSNSNSFINRVLFTIDAINFSYGSYTTTITVTKSGDGSITSSTSFRVQDWGMSVSKRSVDSGFEYGYSIFPDNAMNFDIYPTYRANGTLITGINESHITVTLKDNLNNNLSSTNAIWNSTCGSEGCYDFSMNAPENAGQYNLHVAVSHSSATQTETRVITVIDSVMSAQSTNEDGSLKELFGTNEFVYFSLTAYNLTTSQFNLSDAEVFLVSYMNGTDIEYTEVDSFDLVNATNSVYELAWNQTLQRLKLDVPRTGGVYNVYIFGNNRTIGTSAKFIVNPYDICAVPKDTPGTVDNSNYFYVWQFKTTDTIYFEIKLTQANNPLGKATISNATGNETGSYGMGSNCTVDTSSQQVVDNATLTVVEIKNTESGIVQDINTTESTCQASDNEGGYTCTVKPLDKWEGGGSLVKFNILGQDGTTDTAYGRFEARAFYMYSWSSTWQNSPSSDITLNVQLYEAGRGWWGSSGGLSGSIVVKKVEYQGSDGEWIWPPIDYDYNISAVNSSTVNSGTGTVTLTASNTPDGVWKTGYYRVVLQGTTSSGDTDYGYAWFGVKLWDVYGQPVECNTTQCNYKNYFNSKENITLYVKISPAGNYNYNYYGGQDIGGDVSLGIKKIMDCRTWPCKELNSTQYTATATSVNESSPWYWYANATLHSAYLLYINTTTGSWGTGWYSVTLDVNGTDTGSAWFSTIAFYVATQPTDSGGSNYIYTIRGNETMYFNVTTTKDYRGYYMVYNESDFVNVTLNDTVLRVWNEESWENVEYNYPEDINVTPATINGTALVTLTFANGTNWPTGYYNGELILKNSDNEISRGWIWFRVQPFRVSTSLSSYEIDDTQCMNATLYVYESGWSSNTLFYGNYSIIGVYEDMWAGNNYNQINYSNYTSTTFNASVNITICPNSSGWSTGNWGGYHYLRLLVKDNIQNDTQTGWVSFRAVPFNVNWGSIVGGSNKLTSATITVPVNLTRYSTGESTTGNLTNIYQWRYDNYVSRLEEYAFVVGSCNSSVSGQCLVNGTQNVTIYPPDDGWRVGYNYLYAEWSKSDDSSAIIQDWSGIYIDGRAPYSGYFSSSSVQGYYQYDFSDTSNFSIKLFTQNSTNILVGVNITNVYYSSPNSNCWDDWCRSYTNTSWSLVGGGTETNGSGGSAIVIIPVPSGGWSEGVYYIKADVSAVDGTATITGGSVRVRDSVAPNVTLISPTVNQSVIGSNFIFNATTNEATSCTIGITNYDRYYNDFCSGGNLSNVSSAAPPGLIDSCNITTYGFNGSQYYYDHISRDYRFVSSGANYDYTYSYGLTGLVTGGTAHYYTINTTNLVTNTNFEDQDYGIYIYCYDSDWNAGRAYSAIRVNVTVNDSTSIPEVTIYSPLDVTTGSGFYNSSTVNINITLNENGTCQYTLANATTNHTALSNMTTLDNKNFNSTNTSVADGNYTLYAYCTDDYGNSNSSMSSRFVIDTTPPQISYSGPPANESHLIQNYLTINLTVIEQSVSIMNYSVWNATDMVNSTTYTTDLTTLTIWNLAYGNYSFNVTINDSAGNANSTETRTVTLLEPVNVTLTYPSDNLIVNYSTLDMNYTVNVLSNCTLYWNVTGTFLFNATGVGDSASTFDALAITTNKTYIWNVYCDDVINDTNGAWATGGNYTFTVNASS